MSNSSRAYLPGELAYAYGDLGDGRLSWHQVLKCLEVEFPVGRVGRSILPVEGVPTL